MLKIAIVCGEPSGDLLGAGVIMALRRYAQQLDVEGVAGEHLIAAGCRALYPAEDLAVLGITEVLGRYWSLRRMRQRLCEHWQQTRPDVFIGVDAPDFNLELARQLRASGIRTVHLISPSVWAWRKNRLRLIRQAVDLMLLLFPFEQEIYATHQIPARYIGHPLADTLVTTESQAVARDKLQIPCMVTLIGLCPGSRTQELQRLVPSFLQAAALCFVADPKRRFIIAAVNDSAYAYIQSAQAQFCPELPLQIVTRQAHMVMAAADVLLLASGTVTLEAMLLAKPMVVAYRASWFSYLIFKLLVKIPHVALPNILAGECLVPEYLQYQCQAPKLAAALQHWLSNPAAMQAVTQRFQTMRGELQLAADEQAAKAILGLLEDSDHADSRGR